jgi:hypothetical protein
LSHVRNLNIIRLGGVSICKTDSYQIYFNMVDALVLADALGPSPTLLLERYDFVGHSFRGAARTVVRTTGLIIESGSGDDDNKTHKPYSY